MNINFNNITDAYYSNQIALNKIYGQNGLLLWERQSSTGNYFTIELLENIGYVSDLSVVVYSSEWKDLLYSINDEPWKEFLLGDIDLQTLVLETRNYKTGDKIRLKSNGYDLSVSKISAPYIDVFRSSRSSPYYYHYQFKVYGNPLSLYTDNFNLVTNLNYFRIKDDDGIETILTDVSKLPTPIISFHSRDTTLSPETKLIDASGLELPASILYPSCYANMFCKSVNLNGTFYYYGCTNLTSAPTLPATTLADYCYSQMFYNCTSLTTTPELPATTLANYCYDEMFDGCTGLTSASALPATTLAVGCYYSMFQGCTKLTTAPELLATDLFFRCYHYMFYKCKKLNYVKALFLTNPDTSGYIKDYTDNWLYNVASTGTFIKNSSANWSLSGASGIPTGWTVQNA